MHTILDSVTFQMSLLLFVALLSYVLSARINQSSIIGMVLVGVIIGPSVLNLVTYTGFVDYLAHLGAIILLFVVGLEFELDKILQWRYAVIAMFGVVIPWLVGFLIATLFSFSFTSSLFVGTALTATSIAITAQVLKDFGQLQNRLAQVIIGAAVIDDIIALLILSVTLQVADHHLEIWTIALTFVSAILFILIGSLLGKYFFVRLIHYIDEHSLAKRYPEFVFVFTLAIAFLYALCAELIGLSTIVGAFLAGVVLGPVQLRVSREFREGAHYLQIIFGAIFFTSLGILVDLHQFSWQAILFTIVIIPAALVGKWIGCGVPAFLLGSSKQEAIMVGYGMAPRGEVTMIVALLGLTQGLIPQSIYIALVLMSIITTLVTPILLRRRLIITP